MKKEMGNNKEALAFGAIDIGSNAIRLLISAVREYPHETTFKRVAFVRIPLRLGEDVFTIGRVGEERRKRLLEAMNGFSWLLRATRVAGYKAFATSAMREAENGAAIVSEIREACGLEVEIISGTQEAETIYAGGAGAAMSDDRTYLYVDVGGGSTEVVVYSDHRKVEARSFPLGTVRILKNAVDKEEVKNFRHWLKDVSRLYAPEVIIGSGGNINKVQKLLDKKEKESISYTELKVLYQFIKSFTVTERIHLLGLNAYRADVIVPAMKIFLTIGKIGKINEIIVPKTGLPDGIIQLLYREYPAREPRGFSQQ